MGKPLLRSKRIWHPKVEMVPVPVRSRFSTPSSRTRCKRSKYCRMVLSFFDLSVKVLELFWGFSTFYR